MIDPDGVVCRLTAQKCREANSPALVPGGAEILVHLNVPLRMRGKRTEEQARFAAMHDAVVDAHSILVLARFVCGPSGWDLPGRIGSQCVTQHRGRRAIQNLLRHLWLQLALASQQQQRVVYALCHYKSGRTRLYICLMLIGADGGDRDLLQFIQPALGVGSLAIGFSRLAFGTLLCKSLACSLKSQPRI
jgi:hypothetical protein